MSTHSISMAELRVETLRERTVDVIRPVFADVDVFDNNFAGKEDRRRKDFFHAMVRVVDGVVAEVWLPASAYEAATLFHAAGAACKADGGELGVCQLSVEESLVETVDVTPGERNSVLRRVILNYEMRVMVRVLKCVFGNGLVVRDAGLTMDVKGMAAAAVKLFPTVSGDEPRVYAKKTKGGYGAAEAWGIITGMPELVGVMFSEGVQSDQRADFGLRDVLNVFWASNCFRDPDPVLKKGKNLFDLSYWQLAVLFLSIGRRIQGHRYWIQHPCEPVGTGFTLAHMTVTEASTDYDAVWAIEHARLEKLHKRLDAAVVSRHMQAVATRVDKARRMFEEVAAVKRMPLDESMRLVVDAIRTCRNQIMFWHWIPARLDVSGVVRRLTNNPNYRVTGIDFDAKPYSASPLSVLVDPAGEQGWDPMDVRHRKRVVLDVSSIASECGSETILDGRMSAEQTAPCVRRVEPARPLRPAVSQYQHKPLHSNSDGDNSFYGCYLKGSEAFQRVVNPQDWLEFGGPAVTQCCQFSDTLFGLVVPDACAAHALEPTIGATMHVIYHPTNRILTSMRLRMSAMVDNGARCMHFCPVSGTLLMTNATAQDKHDLLILQRPADLLTRLVPSGAPSAASAFRDFLETRYVSVEEERFPDWTDDVAHMGVHDAEDAWATDVSYMEVVGVEKKADKVVEVSDLCAVCNGVVQYAEVRRLIQEKVSAPWHAINFLRSADGDALHGADKFSAGNGVLALLLDAVLGEDMVLRRYVCRQDPIRVVAPLVDACLASSALMRDGGCMRALRCVLRYGYAVGLQATMPLFRKFITANYPAVLRMAVSIPLVETETLVALLNMDGVVPADLLALCVSRSAVSETMIRLLIRKGASLRAVDPANGTPIFHRVLEREAENVGLGVMAILVEHGYDFSATNRDGCTALDMAVRLGYVELVYALIASAKVDPLSKLEDAELPDRHDFVKHPNTPAAREFRRLFRKSGSDGPAAKRPKKK